MKARICFGFVGSLAFAIACGDDATGGGSGGSGAGGAVGAGGDGGSMGGMGGCNGDPECGCAQSWEIELCSCSCAGMTVEVDAGLDFYLCSALEGQPCGEGGAGGGDPQSVYDSCTTIGISQKICGP